MMMLKPLPGSLENVQNGAVLAFLRGKSAHSDVAEALCRAVAELPGVSTYCADIERYGYCVAAVRGNIFAYARGSSLIGVHLVDPRAALSAGASPVVELGTTWFEFRAFGADVTGREFTPWVREAYAIATGHG